MAAPGRAAEIPFVRTVIARDGPHCPCGKALGDLDGDGRLDAIVAGSEGPLAWYSDPAWSRSVLAAQGYATEGGLAVGDLDRDGDLDVTVGTVWFENPRRPADRPATAPWRAHRIGSGNGMQDVAIGDLDKDGKRDIVVRGETGTVTLFRQRGPRSWVRRDLLPGFGTQGLALADVNRDGFLDILVGGRWLRNPGGKILSQPWQRRSFGSWSPAAALDIGDLNRDGRPDIVMTVADGAGRISWFENPANPGRSGWRERVIDAGPLDSAQGVRLADLDRDGDLDVVTSEIRGAGRLLVYVNAGRGSRWTRQVLGTPALHDIRVADLGGDGDNDILGTLPFGKGPVELWENRLEPQPPREDRILVFSRTAGFRHGSIEPGIAALRSLGAANGFEVDATENAGQFTTANLSRYKAVVFLSTTGDVLDGAQQAAFTAYIRKGGGFVGIHAAADTEHGWPWYGGLVGAYFKSHPEPAQARIRVENRNHSSTRTLPDPWNRFDEWYDFEQNPRSRGVTVLLTLDETSYSGGQMGNDHPIAWFHEYDGGRAWYTGGGHTDESFSEPAFLEHLLGGIRYAAGR